LSFGVWFETKVCEGRKRVLEGDHHAAGGRPRKFIAAVLLGTRSVAANPTPDDLMTTALAQQCLPQVPIGYRHTTRINPSSGHPLGQISRHRTLDILRISDDPNGARFS